jgi:glycerophosphoryl diester phosphodiesterase
LLAGAAVAAPPEIVLVRRVVMPAETFAGGPPAGQYEDMGGYGRRLDRPRFAHQPVQGISSIKPGPRRGTWWALSDNGFGSKWNSLDYRTCIYLFDERLQLLKRIELRDPQRRFPHRLILEADPARPLTGGDIDPESLLVMADGTFWIGDEIGPWLLHFSAAGHLLAPPVATVVADLGTLRSPNHPEVLAGRAAANVRASGGFEGLAASGRGAALRFYALLEKPLPAEADPHDLRLLEFDPRQQRWTGRWWRYRLNSPQFGVGELASTPGGALLALEHDNLLGAEARTKIVFQLPDPNAAPQGTTLDKTPLIDLLALADPHHLGGPADVFRFSYVSLESVYALDANNWLVVNDNDFPASGGRGQSAPNPTEWLWLRRRE